MENALEDEDDSYANAYLLDDDADESDDAELAEMLAKVQSIQLVEGFLQTIETPKPATDPEVKDNQANSETITCTGRLKLTDLKNSQIHSRSPTAAPPSSAANKSQDGITTISRSALNARRIGSSNLRTVKKSAIYEEKLLQAAKTTKIIETLRKKAVASSPATIRKRIKSLSAPIKKSSARKFATDDEEQHCRFQLRTNASQRARASSRDDYDGGDDTGLSFISRMEAAERNRQKKLDLYRNEKDYNARLDKKACPRCCVPQSYSEYKDKKKKCQMCGAEFRFLNAWGDIKHSFISRMAEASRAQMEKKEVILAQVTAEATHRATMNKTRRQLQYEKQIALKQNKRTFLDRNYTPNSDSRTKRAQLELEAKCYSTRSAK